jgi:simple sugar transport system ATP-binding protein
MVGDDLPVADTADVTRRDEIVLSVSGLGLDSESGRAVVEDISFDIHAGEIVGVAGVSGNGQFQLVEMLLGLEIPSRGTIAFEGADVTSLSVADRREAGIAYIPFDRHREALMLGQPLWENMILGQDRSERFGHGPLISSALARTEADEAIRRFDVAAPSADVPAYALSGGNQQKFVVGREMMTEPRLLIAAHPTRGVDIGAQAAIWEELRAARTAGLAVLLVSADLDELIGLSDDLLVMCRGVMTARLDPADATPEKLGLYMAGQRQDVA